jgi:hypothetical protein
MNITLNRHLVCVLDNFIDIKVEENHRPEVGKFLLGSFQVS